MKRINSLKELQEENIEFEVEEVWNGFSKNLNDQFLALNLDVVALENELENGASVFRTKVEAIYKAAINDSEDEGFNHKIRENCKWVLDRLFMNHLVPKTIEGAHYIVPNEFWFTSLGFVIKALLYPEIKKESYIPISAKEAADIIGVSTVYVQKIAAEELEGKKLSSGWVVNLRKVLEYKEGGSGSDMIITIHYGISSERYKKHLIGTGKSIEQDRVFETTLSALSPEIREEILDAVNLYDSLVKRDYFSSNSIKIQRIGDVTKYRDELDRIWEDSFYLENAGIEGLSLHDENVEQYLEKFLEWHKERSIKHNSEDNEQKKEIEAKEKEKNRIELEIANLQNEEKEEWINKHGSTYLQKLLKLDFDCEIQYASERAKKEFPGYKINFEMDWFNYSRNNNPSERALDELIKIENMSIKNGWSYSAIPAFIYYEDGDYARGHEGVVIPNYLGKYALALDFSVAIVIDDSDLPF